MRDEQESWWRRCGVIAALAVIVLIAGVRGACAQPTDTTHLAADTLHTDSLSIDSTRFDLGLQGLVGVQARMGQPLSSRFAVEIHGELVSAEAATVAVIKGRDNLGTLLSLNLALLVPAYLGFFIHPVLASIFLLPQLLPNLTLELPLIDQRLGLVVSQRTDYFWEDDVFRIHTEAQAGLRLYTPSLMIEALYVKPLTNSVMEKQNYLGIGFHYIFIK